MGLYCTNVIKSVFIIVFVYNNYIHINNNTATYKSSIARVGCNSQLLLVHYVLYTISETICNGCHIQLQNIIEKMS